MPDLHPKNSTWHFLSKSEQMMSWKYWFLLLLIFEWKLLGAGYGGKRRGWKKSFVCDSQQGEGRAVDFALEGFFCGSLYHFESNELKFQKLSLAVSCPNANIPTSTATKNSSSSTFSFPSSSLSPFSFSGHPCLLAYYWCESDISATRLDSHHAPSLWLVSEHFRRKLTPLALGVKTAKNK